jgi:serine/threonine-protein kinase
MSDAPSRFGKYTLLRRIAQGGMAEIFLAHQRGTDAKFEKLLVIKRILPELEKEPMFVEMMLHEARIAVQLAHPSLLQVFDTGKIEERTFIAMEHVHGADIRAIVRQMKKKDVLAFPLEHALGIVMGVAAGLAYAHERRGRDGELLGIIHRDVSPQNIMVTFHGDVKLIDFGIARSDKLAAAFGGPQQLDETKTGKLKGKVPYMSPEQCRAELLDARSDVFSLGTVLFELTTGKRLFKGQSDFETLKLICDREYPAPVDVNPDYPAALSAIVTRALAKDREQRYPSARALLGDLETFVREQKLGVSRLALEAFMRDLFAEQLASEQADGLEVPADAPSELEMSAVQRISRVIAPPPPPGKSPVVLVLAVTIAIAAAALALLLR